VDLPGIINVFSCVSRFPMTALFVRDTEANRCICIDAGLAVAACVVYRRESMVWCEGKGKSARTQSLYLDHHESPLPYIRTLRRSTFWQFGSARRSLRRRRTRLPGDGTTDCDQVSIDVCGALATRLFEDAATQSQSNNEQKAVWKVEGSDSMRRL
jgi:hypothetical protein